jgi:hypothetical protein
MQIKERKESFEFGIATSDVSKEAIRHAVESKADSWWSTVGWIAKVQQNYVDMISYSKGSAELKITIQVYKENASWKWCLIQYI